MEYSKTVTAFQWTGDNWDEISKWCPNARRTRGTAIVVPTAIGERLVNAGCWITRDKGGWFEVYDNSAFMQTHVCAVPRFAINERVRVKFGVDRGHHGTVVSVGGDDKMYYGVKLDCHPSPMGYSEYELESTERIVNCEVTP